MSDGNVNRKTDEKTKTKETKETKEKITSPLVLEGIHRLIRRQAFISISRGTYSLYEAILETIQKYNDDHKFINPKDPKYMKFSKVVKGIQSKKVYMYFSRHKMNSYWLS